MLSVVRQFALKPNCNGCDFYSIIFLTVKREFKIDSKILPNAGMTVTFLKLSISYTTLSV